jgi:predicted O-methyltransferase YrrM
MTITIQRTLAEAEKRVGEFEQLIRDVPYERKGIPFSEMFFLYASASSCGPGQILESGRGRGQSTYLLALCFPRTPIVSIELDPRSPDVPIAEARLKGFSNVSLQFGDATRMLPQLARPGDVVLIDGPKGFGALRLALRLLRMRKPAMVFVHDCSKGTAEREFLAKHIPGAFYSDHSAFVEAYARLDEHCRDAGDLGSGKVWSSYGPTLACIPLTPGFSYGVALAKVAAGGLVHHIAHCVRKRIS